MCGRRDGRYFKRPLVAVACFEICDVLEKIDTFKEIMHLPMREKYVDEAVGVFIIFGASDGGVDVATANNDVFSGIPLDKAEEIVAAQERFRNELYQILCRSCVVSAQKL
jgi:hypothetical protein